MLKQLRSTEHAVLHLLTLFFLALGLIMFLPPIAQVADYHNFADTRRFVGLANFLNVVSNGGFLVAGYLGLTFLWGRSRDCFTGKLAGVVASEWWQYFVFFVGAILTALGSAYYHLSPGNETLVWDRLPMTIMFMSLFSAVIGERIDRQAGLQLFVPLLLLGVGSVVNWVNTEALGVGDLRFYAVVQFFPMLALPLILWIFPPRYSHGHLFYVVLGLYVLAKVFEAADSFVFEAIAVSGHTIKHLLGGLSAYYVLEMLKVRSLLAAAAE
jgi:hypothetical protein